MNELKGNKVIILLSVDDGRGFESVKAPVFITANFNDRVIESELVENKGGTLRFNTEMIWETDKKLLRRARGAYNRIRLECITVDRRLVGFALMCLRSAKIVPNSKTELEVQYSWVKILNVPTEFKKGMPELNVSLTIRDFITNKVIPPPILAPGATQTWLDNSIQIPIKYTETGYIQLGNDSQQLERYLLRIVVHIANNLDVLLPETLVFSQVPKKYYLSFQLFGIPVRTHHFTRDLHDEITINETVVIKMLSNYKILALYFRQFPSIPVTFFNDETALGKTQINLTGMNWEAEFRETPKSILEVNETSQFESETVTNTTTRHPTLKTTCSIELTEEDLGHGDQETPRVRFSPYSEGECLFQRAPKDRKAQVTHVEDNASTKIILKNLEIQTTPPESHPAEAYHQFALNIILDSMVWKRPGNSNDFIINFIHPKANTFLNIRTEIERQSSKKVMFENAVCKLTFICVSSRLPALLQAYPVKLQLLDTREIQIANDYILNPSEITIEHPEFSEVITLKSPKNEDLAEVHLCMCMEVNKIGVGCGTTCHLLPHILDDCIIFDDLNELENWKEEEKARFSKEMERTRREETQLLHANWTDRKNKLESELKNNIARCKKLTHALKKNALNKGLDKILEERREDADDDYNFYMEVHKNTVKYSLSDQNEIIQKICLLERDCDVLRDLLNEQNLEMDDIKKNALTGEQTKNLLKDLKALEKKYETAQADKNYFKAEWEKAMKEVHDLKVEDQRNLQDRIALDKEQLSQLSLDSFTGLP